MGKSDHRTRLTKLGSQVAAGCQGVGLTLGHCPHCGSMRVTMPVRGNMSDLDEVVKRLEADPDGRNRVGSFLGADIRTIRAALAEAQRERDKARDGLIICL